jgi:hypothetical protein
VRIGIRDLADPLGRIARPGAFSVPVGLDEDKGGCCGGAAPCGCAEPTPDPEGPRPDGLPTLTILARKVSFLDEEGTPRYGWTPVARGLALMSEEREELNDATGHTMV